MVSNGFDLVRALLISSPSRLSKILYNQPVGYSDTQRQTEPYVSLHNGGLVRPGAQRYHDTQRQTEPYVSLHNGGLVRPGSQRYHDTQRQTEPYVSLHNGGLVRPGSQRYHDAIGENGNAILKFLYHHFNWIF